MFLRPMIQPRPVTLGQLPDGPAGTVETLRHMRALVREFRKNPVIRAQALNLIVDLPPKAYRAEVTRIADFVRDQIRYTRDVRDVETLHWPTVTLDQGLGDCDDKVTLLASLLESVGHPTRFVAIGLGGGPLSHVYLETRIGPRWVGIDPTENWPSGITRFENVTSRYQMDI